MTKTTASTKAYIQKSPESHNLLFLPTVQPLPRSPHRNPFVGYLIVYMQDKGHKARYPKEGVRYRGLGAKA